MAVRASVAALDRLAEECRQCYQCGQCTSACPAGWDFEHGPRRVVRLILAGELNELLECEDVWRCSECGRCTHACPMEVDVSAALAAVRQLQRDHGGARCPERYAADVAARQLGRRARIGNLSFGAAMVARGALPKDFINSAAQGTTAARALLGKARAHLAEKGGASESANCRGGAQPPVEREHVFFTGCSLSQDRDAHAATLTVAAELGLRLAETAAGCCAHPARGQASFTPTWSGTALTACPACEATLREAGADSRPLWSALVATAEGACRRLQAAEPRFVPYVGCLGDREGNLTSLAEAAHLSGAEALRSFPSLHASCCGALGGVFRGETSATRRLLAFAAAASAPIVTTCLLCRDNVRSGARRRRLPVRVYFWPEFFQAAAPDTQAPPCSSPMTKDGRHD